MQVSRASSTWTTLALLLALGFILRIVWLLAVPTVPESDAHWFYQHAARLSQYGDFVERNGAATAERMVGYPALLAVTFNVFGISYNTGKVLNLVLAMIMLVASFDIARLTFKSDKIALWTVGLLALYPNHIAYTSSILSELAFTAFFLVGISYMLRMPVRRWYWLPAGLMFGMVTLIKPYFALAPVVVWAWQIWRRGQRSHHYRLALTMGVLIFVLMPWLLRNWAVFGDFPILSNTSGFNLWIGHHPNASGGFENPTPELSYPQDPQGERERDQQFGEMALQQIKADPMLSIRLIPIKAIGTFKGNIEGFESAYWGTDYDFTLLAILTYIIYLVLLIMALTYPLVRWRTKVHHPEKDLPAPELGGIFVLYTMVVSAIYFGETRFSFPVMPFVFMYTAALLAMIHIRFPAVHFVFKRFGLKNTLGLKNQAE